MNYVPQTITWIGAIIFPEVQITMLAAQKAMHFLEREFDYNRAWIKKQTSVWPCRAHFSSDGRTLMIQGLETDFFNLISQLNNTLGLLHDKIVNECFMLLHGFLVARSLSSMLASRQPQYKKRFITLFEKLQTSKIFLV